MRSLTSFWGIWRLVCEVIGGKVLLEWGFRQFNDLCDRKIAEARQRLDDLE